MMTTKMNHNASGPAWDDQRFGQLAREGRSIRRMYEFAQPEAPVTVTEYLLTTLDGRRCCLLRWLLREEIRIDRLTFSLAQLDEYGNELDASEMTYSHEELPPMSVGMHFVPEWAVPIRAQCVSVRVHLHEIVSKAEIGSYLYRVTPFGVTVDYTADHAWIYDPKAAKKDKLKKRESHRATSKLGRRLPGIWLMALLSLIVVALMICRPYLARIIRWDLVGQFFDEIFRTVRVWLTDVLSNR